MSVEITHNDDEGRYELRLDGELAGFLTYRLTAERIIMRHTEVYRAYEGQGLGSRLVKVALDDARSRGLMVTPICSFAAAYIDAHPEYADLLPEQVVESGGSGI